MRFAVIWLFLAVWSLPVTGQSIEQSEEGYEMMRVFYGGGSSYLDKSQRIALQEWLGSKENLHEYEILVRSHMDNIGSRIYNQHLSELRSESVIRTLDEIAIPREMIRVEDFGEDHPTYSNDTLEGRLSNRRVDVILIPPSS